MGGVNSLSLAKLPAIGNRKVIFRAMTKPLELCHLQKANLLCPLIVLILVGTVVDCLSTVVAILCDTLCLLYYSAYQGLSVLGFNNNRRE